VNPGKNIPTPPPKGPSDTRNQAPQPTYRAPTPPPPKPKGTT